jgi:hypothetical protein
MMKTLKACRKVLLPRKTLLMALVYVGLMALSSCSQNIATPSPSLTPTKEAAIATITVTANKNPIVTPTLLQETAFPTKPTTTSIPTKLPTIALVRSCNEIIWTNLDETIYRNRTRYLGAITKDLGLWLYELRYFYYLDNSGRVLHQLPIEEFTTGIVDVEVKDEYVWLIGAKGDVIGTPELIQMDFDGNILKRIEFPRHILEEGNETAFGFHIYWNFNGELLINGPTGLYQFLHSDGQVRIERLVAFAFDDHSLRIEKNLHEVIPETASLVLDGKKIDITSNLDYLMTELLGFTSDSSFYVLVEMYKAHNVSDESLVYVYQYDDMGELVGIADIEDNRSEPMIGPDGSIYIYNINNASLERICFYQP